jgi:putative hydrolase of HD superfamily
MGSDAPSDPLWTTQSVLSTLPHPPEENSASPIPFFHLLERLKTTKREGWRRFGISTGESISDHMYRMSIMTMLAPPALASRLNLPHCMKMALIHDMAESIVGDITPVDKVNKTEKARREAEVMDYIAKNLLGGVPGGMLTGEEILKVFNEYEANETLEAQFVHDVDKMELLLQMLEYERTHKVDLSEFCHVAGRIQLEEVKEWAATVLKEREAFWKGMAANTNGTA